MKRTDSLFGLIVLLKEKLDVLYRETFGRSIDRAMRELESYKAALLKER